ncbi:unnamed protein product [Chrysoparadoxa australica]
MFDMNQLLHIALRRSSDEEHAISRLFHDINQCLRVLQPRRSVVFAFDGSAPLAKLLTQRKRRDNPKRADKYMMSALHLTPGTEFMTRMAEAVRYYAYQRLQQKPGRGRFDGISFYISGADVPGEGELKIFDWINMNAAVDTPESTVIVGGDADLVLAGLALRKVKNLFIYNYGRAASLVSVWEVVRALEGLYPSQSEHIRNDLVFLLVLNGNDYLPKVRGISFNRCFRQYIHVKDVAQKAGKDGADTLLVDGERRTFNWELLHNFFQRIGSSHNVPDAKQVCSTASFSLCDSARRSPTAAHMLHQAVQQKRIKGGECTFEILPAQEGENCSAWYTKVCIGTTCWEFGPDEGSKKEVKQAAAEAVLKELLPELHDEFLKLREEGMQAAREDAARAAAGRGRRSRHDNQLFDVEAYIRGLLWNIQMYVDGYPPDNYFTYDKPLAPSCKEIATWIERHRWSPPPSEIQAPVSLVPPLPSDVACLAMMSASGRDLVPKSLSGLMDPDSPVGHMFREGMSSEFDMGKLLEAVGEHHPTALQGRSPPAWTVVAKKEQAGLGTGLKEKLILNPALRPPSPPCESFDRVIEASIGCYEMLSTSAPPSLPWSNPVNGSSEQPGDVSDTPYRKPFRKPPPASRGPVVPRRNPSWRSKKRDGWRKVGKRGKTSAVVDQGGGDKL